MNNDISDKDKKDWENFLSSNDALPDKDLSISQKKNLKIKTFDLHGYSLEKANITVKNLINESYQDGINKLIIVTGKGLHSENEKNPYVSKNFGILKYSVPEFIKQNKNLLSLIREIKEASIEDGGAGAFYIYLKKLTK